MRNCAALLDTAAVMDLMFVEAEGKRMLLRREQEEPAA